MMNLSVYIFGKFSSGYSQYPCDYSQEIFEKFQLMATNVSQVVIHRNNDLMYYGYIRKLEADFFIGICVVINGRYINSIDSLFAIFENTIEMMVRNGYLVQYNGIGLIKTNVSRLYENPKEISMITARLQDGFGRLEGALRPLPADNYATAKDSMKTFALEDSEDAIIVSSFTNGYTCVFKKSGNTGTMNTYQQILQRSNGRIAQLEAECKRLNNEVTALKKKSRSIWTKVFGFVAVIFGIIIWVKVLNPNKVAGHEIYGYKYYGEMEDDEPNGLGLAVFDQYDDYNRRFYYGRFYKGNREDEDAVMFFKDGSYFHGSMENDVLKNGVFFDGRNKYFVGEFQENKPWKGRWYKLKRIWH